MKTRSPAHMEFHGPQLTLHVLAKHEYDRSLPLLCQRTALVGSRDFLRTATMGPSLFQIWELFMLKKKNKTKHWKITLNFCYHQGGEAENCCFWQQISNPHRFLNVQSLVNRPRCPLNTGLSMDCLFLFLKQQTEEMKIKGSAAISSIWRTNLHQETRAWLPRRHCGAGRVSGSPKAKEARNTKDSPVQTFKRNLLQHWEPKTSKDILQQRLSTLMVIMITSTSMGPSPQEKLPARNSSPPSRTPRTEGGMSAINRKPRIECMPSILGA